MKKAFVLVFMMVMVLAVSMQAHADLSDGLVAEYLFNGNVNDESGNGNNGTVYGSVALTADRFGNANSAYNFNGTFGTYGISGDYIEVADAPELRFGTGDFSISFWMNSESSTYQSIFSKGYSTNQGDYWLRLNDTKNPPGDISFLTADYYRAHTLLSSDVRIITDGFWHHVVAMRQSSNMSLYLDGEFYDSISGTLRDVDTNNALYFGAFRDPQDNIEKVYDGVLDDITMYNRALAPDEIESLYNAPNTVVPEPISSTLFLIGGALFAGRRFLRRAKVQ